jgi:hypothetical protein
MAASVELVDRGANNDRRASGACRSKVRRDIEVLARTDLPECATWHASAENA